MTHTFINRNFFLLWLGRFVSLAGDRFYGIALVWWLLQKTGSPSVMGWFLVASSLPCLIAGLLTGPFVDRFPRRAILIAADLVRGVVVSAMAFLAAIDHLEVAHIMVAAAIISLGSAFFDPASQALIPAVAGKERVARANSLMQMGSGACMVLGPALGGMAAGFLGYPAVFSINAASYFFCAACALLMKSGQPAGGGASLPYWQLLKEGLAFVLSRRQTLFIIGAIGLAHFFTAGMMLAIPFLADRLPGNGIRNLGWLEMSAGGGFVLGSALAHRTCRRSPQAERLFLFLMMAGICFISLGGMVQQRWGLFPCLAATALFGGMIVNASIIWLSFLQLNSPAHLSGRVFSIASFIGNISMPIAYGVLGAVLQKESLPLFLLTLGGSLAFFGLTLNWSFRKTLARGFPAQTHDPPVEIELRTGK